MKKKALFIWIIVLAVVGIIIYCIKNNNEETSLTLKNETSEEFESVGILQVDKTILNKTNEAIYHFPSSITGSLDRICVIAIRKDGEILKSNVISIKDDENLSIKSIEKDRLKLNVEGKDEEINDISVPSLKNWKVKVDGDNIVGTFKADSDVNYKIYVLGKGEKLGVSDVDSKNNEVVASWEKPKYSLDSWIELTK